MDIWQKYVCENILDVLDPVQNESRAGVTQMLGLISLCMPTNEQGQSRELLMQFLRVASLMVSPSDLHCASLSSTAVNFNSTVA